MTTPPQRILKVLIADDQMAVLEALRMLMKGEGYQPECVMSPAAIIQALEKADFDIVLMDLNYARDTTSGQEGLDLLARIRLIDDDLPVIVMTAWGSVELAVEAMRRGARDFIQKPWDNERLLSIIRNQAELGQALRRGKRLEAENRLLWTEDFTPKVEWTLTLLVLGFWLGFSFSLRTRVVRPLQTISNLLAALREGDFSIRARGGTRLDTLDEVVAEVNAMGATLKEQRLGALEATQLLKKVMEEIDVAVFTFDGGQALRLVNRAGERLLSLPRERLAGRSAVDLGLTASPAPIPESWTCHSPGARDDGKCAGPFSGRQDCPTSCWSCRT